MATYVLVWTLTLNLGVSSGSTFFMDPAACDAAAAFFDGTAGGSAECIADADPAFAMEDGLEFTR